MLQGRKEEVGGIMCLADCDEHCSLTTSAGMCNVNIGIHSLLPPTAEVPTSNLVICFHELLAEVACQQQANFCRGADAVVQLV